MEVACNCLGLGLDGRAEGKESPWGINKCGGWKVEGHRMGTSRQRLAETNRSKQQTVALTVEIKVKQSWSGVDCCCSKNMGNLH
jgi:hypothetical protein